MDDNIEKDSINKNNVQLNNESPILFENKIQIKKENDNNNKDVNNCFEKGKDIKVISYKKDLEQLERRKLLEEYKRKKQEKKKRYLNNFNSR